MKHSFYITLATWLVRADLHREERALQRKIRRSARDIPWHNPHLLRDIGIDENFIEINNIKSDSKAKSLKKVDRIRRRFALRIPT